MDYRYRELYPANIQMRGNCSQVEPLALEQHRQIQKPQENSVMKMTPTIGNEGTRMQSPQQQYQEENPQQEPQQLQTTCPGAPLQMTSPATPGWPIHVKQEPHEEKNNDSGVSPDHYTTDSDGSPQGRVPSNGLANLSPLSAFVPSPDSDQSGHNYSLYINESPMEYTCTTAQLNEKNKKQRKQISTITNGITLSRNINEEADNKVELIEVSPDPLECPVCKFSTQSRLQFSEHLVVHVGKCDAAEVKNSVLHQLTRSGSPNFNHASPPQCEQQPENDTEPQTEVGIRVPRVNSQGKVKTQRCKQCGYIAITKLDFWEHSRLHIKEGKLLPCPKCPFVTEYKHHLEYHWRNHVGSKPYKCDMCDYACVNKSMLNSHLKSHSNVYQYRCADCSYATKYCHSLKLHLRKYNHKPAMVLNADGSPNPLPIVDVYGTKRGPKAKPKKGDQQQRPTPTDELQKLQQMQQLQQLQQQHLAQAQSPTNNEGNNDILTALMLNQLNTFNSAALQGAALPNGLMTPSLPMSMMGMPLASIVNNFTLQNLFSMNNDNNNMSQAQKEQMQHVKETFVDYVKKMYKTDNESSEQEEAQKCVSPSHLSPPEQNNAMNVALEPEENQTATALDLTKTSAAADEAESNNNSLNNQEMQVVPSLSTALPKNTGTSRRKGVAVKLQRRQMEKESEEETVLTEAMLQVSENFKIPAAPTQNSNACHPGLNHQFYCPYCDVSFGNNVMHSVHMGYHSAKNPFTCNVCGLQCPEQVSFFLHITRTKH